MSIIYTLFSLYPSHPGVQILAWTLPARAHASSSASLYRAAGRRWKGDFIAAWFLVTGRRMREFFAGLGALEHGRAFLPEKGCEPDKGYQHCARYPENCPPQYGLRKNTAELLDAIVCSSPQKLHETTHRPSCLVVSTKENVSVGDSGPRSSAINNASKPRPGNEN